MKLILTLQQTNEYDEPQGTAIHSAMLLPHGCGLDHATAEIEKVSQSFKSAALEIYKANTEGRPLDFNAIAEA